MITLDQLGMAVRRKRDTRRLEDVAKEAKVSAATLSRVESGTIPTMETVRKLAEWLGVNIRAAGGEESGITSEEDLERAVEVYLRADKKLTEGAARSIAEAVRAMMEWKVEEAKRKGL